METKGLTCKIPLELHEKISAEIKQNESTMGKFIEQIIMEHYAKGATTMEKRRTLAFQVSEEFFQQVKEYLARYKQIYHRELSQKEFVIGLIEQALAEADEEFEAAEAAAAEDRADESEYVDQESEVADDVEAGEDAESEDAPEGDAETDEAPADCESDCESEEAGCDEPEFSADAEREV